MDDRGRGAESLRAVCTAGLALLFAADWCSDLLQAAPAGALDGVVDLAARLAGVALYVLCAALPGQARGFGESRRALGALAVLLAAARVAQVFGGALASGMLAGAGAVVAGAAQAFLMLLWLSRVCAFTPRGIACTVCSAYLATGVAYFVLMPLPPLATTAVLCLAPAVSAAVALAAARAGASEPEASGQAPGAAAAELAAPEPGWTFPVYPVALMVIFKFVFYFSLSLTSGPSMWGPLGIVIVAGGTAAFALFAYDRFHVSMLYKLALPCMVAGLLLVAWVHVGDPAATLAANAGNIAFELFLVISLAEACGRFGINPLWMFGIVQAASAVAGGLGFRAGIMFTGSYPAGSFESNLLMMAVVVGLVAVSAFVFNERMAGRTFGTQPVATERGQDAPVPMFQEDLERRCDRIARQYDLSRRETEILELLAQGMSGARIQEELVISRNTVKSHTRHIYEKLGVHSRDEARTLVDEMR